ncbi:hypothetical protein KSC_083260 [Ktedonobacter sp. SOSP1-52]|nr:hypothetical protein KSC_083260 [Ktedonobacter sp. SOSP1-52]
MERGWRGLWWGRGFGVKVRRIEVGIRGVEVKSFGVGGVRVGGFRVGV